MRRPSRSAPGLFRGWRGHVGFEALSATLPGGIELRPLGGTVKSDGQSLQLEALKGKIGGGDVNGSLDARSNANGITLNARVELAGVDGAALHYRGLKMPTGRTSAQMTLMSQGRSLEALTGALSGNGTVKLESAAIAGLDPRALDVAIRASDLNQVPDDDQAAAGRRFRAVRGGLPRRFAQNFPSSSATGGFASTPPRWRRKARAPSCPAATTSPRIRPIFAQASLRP